MALDVAEGRLIGVNNLGTASLADADGTQGNAVSKSTIGVAVKAAKYGTMCAVAPIATVDGFSALTIGGLVPFDVAAGGVTQTKPVTNGFVQQIVGVARTATEVLFHVCPPLKFATSRSGPVASY